MGSLLCVRHYTWYIIIVAHGKSCARACVHWWYTGTVLLLPSRFLASSSFPSPRPLSSCLTLLLAISYAAPCLLVASCATVNHSACDCVRLITVIRPFLVPVYRPLIIIIDFSSVVRHFLIFMPASLRPRGCTNERILARPRESLSFGSLHPWPVCQFAIHRKCEIYVAKPRAEITAPSR